MSNFKDIRQEKYKKYGANIHNKQEVSAADFWMYKKAGKLCVFSSGIVYIHKNSSVYPKTIIPEIFK